jgi:hypothetical protein
MADPQEVVIIYEGQERLRFLCRDFGDNYVVTGRHHRAPPVPVGAEVHISSELTGRVVALNPSTLPDRYNIHYAPVSEKDERLGGDETADEAVLLQEGERGPATPAPDPAEAATEDKPKRKRRTRRKKPPAEDD